MPLSLGNIRIVPLIIEKAHPDFLVRGNYQNYRILSLLRSAVIYFHLQHIISQKSLTLE